jgi:hypothetical protein
MIKSIIAGVLGVGKGDVAEEEPVASMAAVAYVVALRVHEQHLTGLLAEVENKTSRVQFAGRAVVQGDLAIHTPFAGIAERRHVGREILAGNEGDNDSEAQVDVDADAQEEEHEGMKSWVSAAW